jgi:hypothetical protein
MTVETLLRSLSRIPRPQVPPFWAARVTARATEARRAPATPRVMWLYWIALASIGGPLLLTSWERLAAVAAGALALRAVVLVTARVPTGRATSSRTPGRY